MLRHNLGKLLERAAPSLGLQHLCVLDKYLQGSSGLFTPMILLASHRELRLCLARYRSLRQLDIIWSAVYRRSTMSVSFGGC
jgi:hypothetical protein